jgi:hypothetical protein
VPCLFSAATRNISPRLGIEITGQFWPILLLPTRWTTQRRDTERLGLSPAQVGLGRLYVSGAESQTKEKPYGCAGSEVSRDRNSTAGTRKGRAEGKGHHHTVPPRAGRPPTFSRGKPPPGWSGAVSARLRAYPFLNFLGLKIRTCEEGRAQRPPQGSLIKLFAPHVYGKFLRYLG